MAKQTLTDFTLTTDSYASFDAVSLKSLIKERLKKGAEDYHMNIPITPADDINRDNFYEAVQEALDLSVYLAAYLLRLMEEKERREGEPTTADEHNDKDKYENREEKESSA